MMSLPFRHKIVGKEKQNADIYVLELDPHHKIVGKEKQNADIYVLELDPHR
jgi:hypothetical protein